MIGIVQLPVTPPTPIRTERLVLRPFRADDVEPLLAFHSDPEAVRYVPYPPRDRAQVAAVVELKRANTKLAADGDLVEFAVEIAETGPVIGDVLLALRSTEHQTLEIGYIFTPATADKASPPRRFEPSSISRSASSAPDGSSPGSTPAIGAPAPCWSGSASDWRHIWSRTNGSKES